MLVAVVVAHEVRPPMITNLKVKNVQENLMFSMHFEAY